MHTITVSDDQIDRAVAALGAGYNEFERPAPEVLRHAVELLLNAAVESILEEAPWYCTGSQRPFGSTWDEALKQAQRG